MSIGAQAHRDDSLTTRSWLPRLAHSDVRIEMKGNAALGSLLERWFWWSMRETAKAEEESNNHVTNHIFRLRPLSRIDSQFKTTVQGESYQGVSVFMKRYF